MIPHWELNQQTKDQENLSEKQMKKGDPDPAALLTTKTERTQERIWFYLISSSDSYVSKRIIIWCSRIYWSAYFFDLFIFLTFSCCWDMRDALRLPLLLFVGYLQWRDHLNEQNTKKIFWTKRIGIFFYNPSRHCTSHESIALRVNGGMVVLQWFYCNYHIVMHRYGYRHMKTMRLWLRYGKA